jgi:hypothetical protein
VIDGASARYVWPIALVGLGFACSSGVCAEHQVETSFMLSKGSTAQAVKSPSWRVAASGSLPTSGGSLPHDALGIVTTLVQGFLTTAEPPETVTALAAVPAVAVPGESVVVVVFEVTPSSPTVMTVVTVRTADTAGIAVFAGAPTATK